MLIGRLRGLFRRSPAAADPAPRREPVRALPRALREPPPAPTRPMPSGLLGLVFPRDVANVDADGRIIVKAGTAPRLPR